LSSYSALARFVFDLRNNFSVDAEDIEAVMQAMDDDVLDNPWLAFEGEMRAASEEEAPGASRPALVDFVPRKLSNVEELEESIVEKRERVRRSLSLALSANRGTRSLSTRPQESYPSHQRAASQPSTPHSPHPPVMIAPLISLDEARKKFAHADSLDIPVSPRTVTCQALNQTRIGLDEGLSLSPVTGAPQSGIKVLNNLPGLTLSSPQHHCDPAVSERYLIPRIASAPDQPRFFFSDGNISFLVKGVIYRVHRYFFCRDSPYFANLLSKSPRPHESALTPVVLEDVQWSEFEAFLSILYPTYFHESDVKTVEEWTAVLRLSTAWSFSSIRTLAIERLEPIVPPVEKLMLSSRGWFPDSSPSLRESLCIRRTGASTGEVEKMIRSHLKIQSAPETKANNLNMNTTLEKGEPEPVEQKKLPKAAARAKPKVKKEADLRKKVEQDSAMEAIVEDAVLKREAIEEPATTKLAEETTSKIVEDEVVERRVQEVSPPTDALVFQGHTAELQQAASPRGRLAAIAPDVRGSTQPMSSGESLLSAAVDEGRFGSSMSDTLAIGQMLQPTPQRILSPLPSEADWDWDTDGDVEVIASDDVHVGLDGFLAERVGDTLVVQRGLHAADNRQSPDAYYKRPLLSISVVYDDLLPPSTRASLSLSDIENFESNDLSDSMSSPQQQRSDMDKSGTMAQPNAPLIIDEKPSPKTHPRFYFDDGNIDFLVGDMLYRVHRYFFCRDSLYFVDLLLNHFASASTNDPPVKSMTVALKDVECSEFDAFLSILYPTKFHECDVTTVEGWTSVLRLSAKWSFSSVRTLATGALQRIASPVDKVVLGRTYDIGAWLRPNLVALCDREQPLTMDEGLRLGVRDVILITSVRESLRVRSQDTSRAQAEKMVDRHLKPKNTGAIPGSKAERPKEVVSVPPEGLPGNAIRISSSVPAKESSTSVAASACSAQDDPWKRQPARGRALSNLKFSERSPATDEKGAVNKDPAKKVVVDETASTARPDKQPKDKASTPQGPLPSTGSSEVPAQNQGPSSAKNNQRTEAHSSSPYLSPATKDPQGAPTKTTDISSQGVSKKGVFGWAALLIKDDDGDDSSGDESVSIRS
ncbi:hypothetical protein EVG20_g8144, partial [Dentipellis fragilis]